jgi:hypothetical protein
MAPLAALGIVGPNPTLGDVAREADQRLRAALTAVERSSSNSPGDSSIGEWRN